MRMPYVLERSRLVPVYFRKQISTLENKQSHTKSISEAIVLFVKLCQNMVYDCVIFLLFFEELGENCGLL